MIEKKNHTVIINKNQQIDISTEPFFLLKMITMLASFQYRIIKNGELVCSEFYIGNPPVKFTGACKDGKDYLIIDGEIEEINIQEFVKDIKLHIFDYIESKDPEEAEFISQIIMESLKGLEETPKIFQNRR